MASGRGNEILKVQDVSVTYHEARTKEVVVALKNVSLSVKAGECVAILGRNGAGKSSLLKAIAGLIPVSSGRVRAQSRPVLMSVNSALLPDLTGRENAYLGSLALGMSAKAAREAVGEIIEFAGLAEAQDRALRTYSTGMAARLKFAICTAQPQDILIMDEALSVGDQTFQALCQDKLESIQRESGAVLLTSHSLSLLEKTCQRAVVIDNATVAYDGPISNGIDLYKSSLAVTGK